MSYISVARSAERLVLSGIEGSVNSAISFSVLKEAYGQLGIEIEYLPLPGERALQTSNSGRVDGEVFRIANIENKYPNLVAVPTSINVLEGVAFSHMPGLPINSWQDLSAYRVGIQNGIKFAERGTRGMNRIKVDNNVQLFRMLDAQRVDVIVVALANGLDTLNQLKQSGRYASTAAIQQFPLYHYLHYRHRHLIPRLDTVLRQMRQLGRIKAIREAALEKLRIDSSVTLKK